MADPLTVFSNFVIVPADDAVNVSLTPTIKFNCDNFSGTARSNYNENGYNMRIVVNAETVYTSPLDNSHLWYQSTGGSRRMNQPVTTSGGSYGTWYTLTEGQGDLTYGLTYRVSVDLKHYLDETWTEVIHADFTTLAETFPPESAINPTPVDMAEDIPTSTDTLTWEDGGSGEHAATSYNVFLTYNYPYDTLEFVGEVSGTEITLSDYSISLVAEVIYTWYVQSINVDGTADSSYWTFTTETEDTYPPESPVNPTPTDEASDILFSQLTLTWEDGGSGDTAATSYEVRIGQSNDESMIVVASGPETTCLISVTLLPGLWYWRVDASNDDGTTLGTTWTFTINQSPIRNVADSGAWHPGGDYTFDAYVPDEYVTLMLSDNDASDSTGEIKGSSMSIIQALSATWAKYLARIPIDSETGTFYIKWNYNNE